jgi:hypothetical protein
MGVDVRSHGYIGVLVTPLGDAQANELREELEKGGSILSVNNEGTLLFSDLNHDKPWPYAEEDRYRIDIGVPDHKEGMDTFVEAAQAIGHSVLPESVEPYDCIWYTENAFPLKEITLADYGE